MHINIKTASSAVVFFFQDRIEFSEIADAVTCVVLRRLLRIRDDPHRQYACIVGAQNVGREDIRQSMRKLMSQAS